MNYYNEIKKELVNNEIYKKVKDYSKNKNDLATYYNVGKLLIEAQGGETRAKYGDKLIKEYSVKMFLDTKLMYSISVLKRMRQFYLMIEKGATLSHQLSWSHYVEILSLKDINEINYYIRVCEEQNLSVRELRSKIKNNEYERLDDKTKIKLINKEETEVKDLIKNPIAIKNNSNYKIISERLLQKLIMEDISSFLDELGSGFSFIKNEYKIKIGNKYNYLDFLLYNIKFKCYVVIELKILELRKEHIGQIQTYMNYVDKNIKTIDENKTIGIIIVKKADKYIMEYCSDDRIITKEYELV